MAKKIKVGFQLPPEVAKAFRAHCGELGVGKKEQWLVITSAILEVMKLPRTDQEESVRQVKMADLPGGSFDRLVETAKPKKRRTYRGIVGNRVIEGSLPR